MNRMLGAYLLLILFTGSNADQIPANNGGQLTRIVGKVEELMESLKLELNQFRGTNQKSLSQGILHESNLFEVYLILNRFQVIPHPVWRL